MAKNEFTKLEGLALSLNKPNILNEWFKLLVNSENKIVMSITEKAKFTTLFHLCTEYKLTEDFNASRLKLISLVRKEVNRQKIELVKKEKIMKDNKLIAEFMGYKQDKNNEKYKNTSYWFKEGKEPLVLLSFHYDWNWLMEVVEKIESLGSHGFTIYRKTTNINGLPIELANTRKSTKIEAVYNACVEFIKWYNINKE